MYNYIMDKYYKIQKFDRISMSWIDRQKSYTSLEEAQKEMPKTVKSRIMIIEGKSRTPLISV